MPPYNDDSDSDSADDSIYRRGFRPRDEEPLRSLDSESDSDDTSIYRRGFRPRDEEPYRGRRGGSGGFQPHQRPGMRDPYSGSSGFIEGMMGASPSSPARGGGDYGRGRDISTPHRRGASPSPGWGDTIPSGNLQGMSDEELDRALEASRAEVPRRPHDFGSNDTPRRRAPPRDYEPLGGFGRPLVHVERHTDSIHPSSHPSRPPGFFDDGDVLSGPHSLSRPPTPLAHFPFLSSPPPRSHPQRRSPFDFLVPLPGPHGPMHDPNTRFIPANLEDVPIVATGARINTTDLTTAVSNPPPDTTCPICMEAKKEGEDMRQPNGCEHHFHLECLDEWVNGSADNSNKCPVCRTEICREQRGRTADVGGPGGARSRVRGRMARRARLAGYSPSGRF